MTTENSKILYHSFNQNLEFFLIGTKEGCTIYQTTPLRRLFELSKKICSTGDLSMVKMLNSSNLFIIIGSEKNTNLNKRQAIVWDNNKEIEVYKFTIENEILNL